MTNPFDNERGSYFVILNGECQYSLWPDHLPVPAGWRTVHGPADRSTSTHFVDAHWTDLRPASLVARAG